MTEPDVALTDFALAIECTILAVALVMIFLGTRWLIARPPLRVGSTA